MCLIHVLHCWVYHCLLFYTELHEVSFKVCWKCGCFFCTQVTQVSDVIKLNTNVTNQASFYVVDNEANENVIYDTTKWPHGVHIRPFKGRARATRHQGSQSDHGYWGSRQQNIRKINYHTICKPYHFTLIQELMIIILV